ncbi:hypothetical protein LTR09_011557 [Extremus antarcticus]|uniref:Uncharacterized protein n=1 Tax=Extremus antarcticus TaxID=702011 RepID=A0AAJ0DBL7_9PEZI|nr:hypothetical protein LTR09_011557 [Extremus antarcticus]
MESKSAFPYGFVNHHPHEIRDTPSALLDVGAASHGAHIGGLPSTASAVRDAPHHGLGAGPFDARDGPELMRGIDGLPRDEMPEQFGPPQTRQVSMAASHGQVIGGAPRPSAGTGQSYCLRPVGMDSQLGQQPTTRPGRLSQPGFFQSRFRLIQPAPAAVAPNTSANAQQAPPPDTHGSTTGRLEGAALIDAVVNELLQPNRQIAQLPDDDFELEFGSVDEAEAELNSRARLIIPGDDVHAVEPNPQPYVRLVMRAMMSSGCLGPHDQGLDRIQTRHWNRWQKDALLEVKKVLSIPLINRQVEALAWTLVNDAIIAHKNGFPASSMKPSGDDRKVKISARITKVAQIITDFPIIRHDVLTKRDAITQLVSTPCAYVGRKKTNRHGNCHKEEIAKKAKAELKKAELRRSVAIANGERVDDEDEQNDAEGPEPEEDGAGTDTRAVQPDLTQADYTQNFSVEQRKQITQGLKRKATMDQYRPSHQQQGQNSPATIPPSQHHANTAFNTPNVD